MNKQTKQNKPKKKKKKLLGVWLKWYNTYLVSILGPEFKTQYWPPKEKQNKKTPKHLEMLSTGFITLPFSACCPLPASCFSLLPPLV
jgi:hypothetical protein